MAADLGKLTPELGDKVSELLDRCRARGIEMRPNAGLRDPFEQARLWRQSISTLSGSSRSSASSPASIRVV